MRRDAYREVGDRQRLEQVVEQRSRKPIAVAQERPMNMDVLVPRKAWILRAAIKERLC